MSQPKKLLVFLAAALFCGLSVLLIKSRVERDLRTANIDFGPLAKLVSARFAQVVTIPVSGGTNAGVDEKFAATYMSALKLSVYVKDNVAQADPPQSAGDLTNIEDDTRFDAWGHPFCYARKGNRVAVFSGGRQGVRSDDCQAFKSLENDIPALKTGLLNLYPTGVLVVVVSDAAQETNRSAEPK